MRSIWNQMPMMRIAISVIAGIGTEIFADFQLHRSAEILLGMLFLLNLSFLIAVIISLIKKVDLVYRLRVLNGVSLNVCLISFGYSLTWLYTDKNYQNHFQLFLQEENFIVARIIKPPLEKEKVITVIAQVEEVKSANNSTATKGNILINILRDSSVNDLQYGDVIVFKSKIEEFDEPKNPEEFSFKLYQSFHNIYNRTFLKPGSWRLVAHDHGNFFMSNIYRIREYFLSLIIRYVKDKNDFAVASAIMLGYNDYMNGDITRAYASSGALHVLSVSGLHVGIMFFMLNILLKPMDNRGRKMVVAKAIIIIAFIWFYACLTGLSPSVLRSAAMFSMIQAGTVLIRNVNIYNVIFGSALVLMLFNPFIITEVGFKLSYLAVLGIIYIQPKISSLLVIGTAREPSFRKQRWLLKPFYFLRYDLWWFFLKIADLGWQIIAVSIAAQIATCPLSLLYFHQFPNLFLLSNLVVIPVSNLILFLGTALCAVGEISFLNEVIGWCFSHLLWLLNKFIFWIGSIPFGLISGISITMIEMALLYFLILLLCWLTEEKKVKVLVTSLLIVFGLSVFYSYEQIIKSRQKKIFVYSVPKQSAIAFIDGRKVMHDFDNGLISNESSMLFHVKHHWWYCGVKEEVTSVGSTQLPFGKLILFEEKKILIVDTALEKNTFELKNKLKVDLVVLSHNPKVYLENLSTLVDFNEVVFDSSNKLWRINYWKKDCDKMQIKYWNVTEQGAYVKDFGQILI
ncbi:MAG: ComEC/Rec2 family competence protein [Bacteroidota bacterium]